MIELNATILFQQLLSGISIGILLFLVSSGLTLVFGVTRVINFAHGSFFMMAAFFAWTVTQCLNFLTSIIFVPVIVAAFGGVLEMSLFRRIYRSEHLVQLLLTYALVFMLGDLTKVIWGVSPKSSVVPYTLVGNITFHGIVIPKYRIFVFLLGVGIMIGLWFLLNRSTTGRYIRAAAEDAEILGTLGINVPRLFTLVFMIGTWLASLGGVVASPIITIILGIDIYIIIQCFIVIIIGGMGSIGGAFLGALAIGITDAFGVLIFPRFVIALIYGLMAIVLIIRPSGFLGKYIG